MSVILLHANWFDGDLIITYQCVGYVVHGNVVINTIASYGKTSSRRFAETKPPHITTKFGMIKFKIGIIKMLVTLTYVRNSIAIGWISASPLISGIFLHRDISFDTFFINSFSCSRIPTYPSVLQARTMAQITRLDALICFFFLVSLIWACIEQSKIPLPPKFQPEGLFLSRNENLE
jgi:hypothetical protein